MEKFYGGIDIHKESYVGCIIEKDGNINREHTFPSSKKAIEQFLCNIPSSEITIAIEACGLWRGVYRVLTDIGYEIKLANPKKTHDIACKKKTDKVDAKLLADLLRTNYLPEVWIQDEQTLRFRDFTRHKPNLTRLRTQVQCKIKSYLLRKGMNYDKLWNETAISKLAEEDLDIKNLVNIYHNLKEEEREVMKRIKQLARNRRETTLLMSMPGIAEFSSLMILAEIGDIKRFHSPKELISYAGLCRGIYQTGATERSFCNTAVNKWLKWIIYVCSRRVIMLDPRFQDYFYVIKRRKVREF